MYSGVLYKLTCTTVLNVHLASYKKMMSNAKHLAFMLGPEKHNFLLLSFSDFPKFQHFLHNVHSGSPVLRLPSVQHPDELRSSEGAHQRSDKDLRKAMAFVLSKCYLGDWFILNQVKILIPNSTKPV